MAYTPHNYVTMGGTLDEQGDDDEIWQIGIRGFNTVNGLHVNPPSEHDQLLDAMVPLIQAWFQAVTSHHGSSAHLDFVKIANIGADGRYTTDATQRDFAAVPGGGSGPSLPTFCSLVYTFDTGHRAGKAAHGRVYPPNYQIGLNGQTSSITVGEQNDLVTAARQLLSAVSRDTPQAEFKPYVVSSSGEQRPITAVRIGNVVDVQRRRKYAVPEVYRGGPWPA